MAGARRKTDDELPTDMDLDEVEIFDLDEMLPEDEVPIEDLKSLDEEEADELSEEDDDNPYNDSDEALPDDAEEAAIRRDLSREDDDDA